MRIFWRYFAKRYAALFFSLLAISVLCIAAIEMLLNFDQILASRKAGGGLLAYLGLRLPAYYLPDLLPITAFAAAFFTLSASGQARELVAMRAAGVSPHTASAAIMSVALLLSLGTFLLSETWVLRSAAAWTQLQNAGSAAVSFRGGTFWYHSDRAIYNIAYHPPPAGGGAQSLEDVRVFRLGPEGRVRQILEASRGRYDDPSQQWILENGWIRHFEAENPRWPAAAEPFAEYPLDLSHEEGRALGAADASQLSLGQVRALITERRAQGSDVARLQQQMHARLARPASVWLLALLALPLGLRVDGIRSLGRRARQGIGLVLGFFSLRSAADILAGQALLPGYIGSWGLLALCGVIAGAMLLRVPR